MKASITVKVDAKGGLLIESAGAAVRVYASETADGGLYFEFAIERGKRGHVSSPERARSFVGTVGPEAVA